MELEELSLEFRRDDKTGPFICSTLGQGLISAGKHAEMYLALHSFRVEWPWGLGEA